MLILWNEFYEVLTVMLSMVLQFQHILDHSLDVGEDIYFNHVQLQSLQFPSLNCAHAHGKKHTNTNTLIRTHFLHDFHEWLHEKQQPAFYAPSQVYLICTDCSNVVNNWNVCII